MPQSSVRNGFRIMGSSVLFQFRTKELYFAISSSVKCLFLGSEAQKRKSSKVSLKNGLVMSAVADLSLQPIGEKCSVRYSSSWCILAITKRGSESKRRNVIV